MPRKPKSIPVSSEPLTCTGCQATIEVSAQYGLDSKKRPFHFHCLLNETADDSLAESKEAGPQEASSPETSGPVFPIYEGAQVIEVLEENIQGAWHHCRMSDGTTKHVPKKLFSGNE